MSEINGTVVDVDEVAGDYGLYLVVTLRLQDGSERVLHGLGGQLNQQLVEADPQPGDFLMVTELEPGEIDHRPVRRYSVQCLKT